MLWSPLLLVCLSALLLIKALHGVLRMPCFLLFLVTAERAALLVCCDRELPYQLPDSRFRKKAGALVMDTLCYALLFFLLPHETGFFSIPTCALWHHRFLLTR